MNKNYIWMVSFCCKWPLIFSVLMERVVSIVSMVSMFSTCQMFSSCNRSGKDYFNGAKMRLINQRREFHYLQLFHFVCGKRTLKDTQEKVININNYKEKNKTISVLVLTHFDPSPSMLFSTVSLFTTKSVCSYHCRSFFMEWA